MNRATGQMFWSVVILGIVFTAWYVWVGGNEGMEIRIAKMYLNAQKQRLDISYSNYDWAWKPTPARKFPDLQAVLEPVPPEISSDTLYYLGSDKGYSLFFDFGRKRVLIDSKTDRVRVEDIR